MCAVCACTRVYVRCVCACVCVCVSVCVSVCACAGVQVCRSSPLPLAQPLTYMPACLLACPRVQVIPPPPGTASLWVLPSGGVMSVDAQFTNLFGHHATDLEGETLEAVMVDSTDLNKWV